MLVCTTCARVVIFDRGGWNHRDGSDTCGSVVVAWPPPIEDDEPTSDAA